MHSIAVSSIATLAVARACRYSRPPAARCPSTATTVLSYSWKETRHLRCDGRQGRGTAKTRGVETAPPITLRRGPIRKNGLTAVLRRTSVRAISPP